MSKKSCEKLAPAFGLVLALTAADGFAAPLFGLATAPNGDILVADAGAGVVVFDGEAQLDLALPGVTDVSPIGRGAMWVIRGAGPTEPGGEPNPLVDSGQALLRVSQGRVRTIVNLFEFEAAHDPDGAPNGGPDSNPFDVQALGGEAALVADAGGNDLLRIDNRGNVQLLATFPDEVVSTQNFQDLTGCVAPFCPPPSLPAQAVPTSVAIGPDGYYYIGELKGFPAPLNESRIWRVSPTASGSECPNVDCEVVFDGGFTSIIDLAFGPDGTLYVTELDESSWFAVEVTHNGSGGTVNACDVYTLACTEVATGIPQVTAITFGTDGRLWAAKSALVPGEATVVEVP